MIYFLLAFATFLLAHFIVLKINKKKLSEMREDVSYKRIVYELSGIVVVGVLALIIYAFSLPNKEKPYLANDDLIYGHEFSSVAEEIGFYDGDKIISINGKYIEDFSDIENDMLSIPSPVQLLVVKQQDTLVMKIDKPQKEKLESYYNLDSGLNIKPKYIENRDTLQIQPTIIHKKKEVFKTFWENVKLTYGIYEQKKDRKYKSVGASITISSLFPENNFKWKLRMFATFLVIIFAINLIPFPGFSIGNTLIAIIEVSWKKLFDKKPIKQAKIIFLILFGVLFVVSLIDFLF